MTSCFVFLLLGYITILDAPAWSLSEPLKQHVVNILYHMAESFHSLQHDVPSDATRPHRATGDEEECQLLECWIVGIKRRSSVMFIDNYQSDLTNSTSILLGNVVSSWKTG